MGVHSDENIYPKAAKFEPFRFCNGKAGEEPDEKNDTIPVKSTGNINVADMFSPLGAGKFAWYAYSYLSDGMIMH